VIWFYIQEKYLVNEQSAYQIVYPNHRDDLFEEHQNQHIREDEQDYHRL
jgi:hypothetical protein